MKFKDKVVLITGASRGIGRSTALLFASQGAKVAVNYVSNKNAADEVVNRIIAKKGHAIAVQADVSNPDDIQRMFVETLQAFGTIDVLINNAGAHVPKSFWEINWQDWEKVLHTNVIGSFMCAREAGRIMLDRKSGVIVNVASVRGLFHCGRVGNLDYSAAKSAVISMTTTMAKELAPHVRVNAIAPGPTETDLTASWDKETLSCAINDGLMKRLMKPEEIAQGILFLSSPEASGITGHVLVVDGGYSLK